jgi:hypothetical protein
MLSQNKTKTGRYDIIVAGAGVAGIAAAITARRQGKSVLLLEKSVILGGLATLGLINYYVPMCNGRGTRIIYGLIDEFIERSVRYGWEIVPDVWRSGEPDQPTEVRYGVRYSPNIFALALTEYVLEEGVDLLFDTLASEPVMQQGICTGVVVENKSGRTLYESAQVIDTTGDADLLVRAGVPTRDGGNFFSYISKAIDLAHCAKAIQSGRIDQAICNLPGGNASLYGDRHPEGMPLFTGISGDSVNDYVIRNQLALLDKIRCDDKNSREIVTLPGMVQFRTTRCIAGDYCLQEADAYRHFDDSIAVMNDFEKRDILYEIPYRTLVCRGYDNLITAGRSASGSGYAWDCLRVIPPAILTGQTAGLAASQAIDTGRAIWDLDIPLLQQQLAGQKMMIHFDDRLVVNHQPVTV